jgi:alkylated DNA repair dioxygenase AlkB
VSAACLLDLGPPEIPPIPGLSLRRNYIGESTEGGLVALIDAMPWDTSWDRRRQLYGYAYGRGQPAPPPIPSWGIDLAERMFADQISERPFDQMLVNEYLPGQGITLHRDYEPFDRTVVSLSLLSDCVMDFRRVADGQRESLLLERRSLLVLSDAARYEWEHGIARRKTDRWLGVPLRRGRRLSVTFRLSKL